MIKAVLTIDDMPQKNTRTIIDYMNEEQVPIVMFGIGQDMERDPGTVVYALRHGVIVGNHTWTHPNLSELSWEDGLEEVERTERLLDRLYEEAGVERKWKLFRFPFISKGGANRQRYQDYLVRNGFVKIDDRMAVAPVYARDGHGKDMDVACSIDCEEYTIRPGTGIGISQILDGLDRKLGEVEELVGKDGDATEIVLLHSHDLTDELAPGYYRTIVEKFREHGVAFAAPSFRKR